jgi:enhancing lycopene biosynthesis protein 2
MFKQVTAARQFFAIQQRKGIHYTYKAAVLLHGCGVYDGAETTETVAALVGLSRAGAQVTCFAPNRTQYHVVNHLSGFEDTQQKRNILEESARIARGNVKDLNELMVEDFDALIVPGGFGAAKNLSDFGIVGEKMKVQDDVAKVLTEFKDSKKVIGLSCIAPILAAKTFEGKKIKMTMGGVKGDAWPFAGASQLALTMGHVMNTGATVQDVVYDTEHRIVTTPAYMQANARPHEVYDGMSKFITYVSHMVK